MILCSYLEWENTRREEYNRLRFLTDGQKGAIVAISVYSPKSKMCAPCGACRQWIWEFSKGKEVNIILEAENGGLYTTTIQEVLPLGFLLDT